MSAKCSKSFAKSPTGFPRVWFESSHAVAAKRELERLGWCLSDFVFPWAWSMKSDKTSGRIALEKPNGLS